jgi:hypothetical protein
LNERLIATQTPAAALAHPFGLLATQPIIQVLAAYQLFIRGVMDAFVATLPGLWATAETRGSQLRRTLPRLAAGRGARRPQPG